jgi:hypothetical protein
VPVNLDTLFNELINDSTSYVMENDLCIKLDLQNSYEINGNPGKLRRVFQNILENALEAVNPNGSVWITAIDAFKGDQPFVRIVIGNTGSYMPKETAERVFESFFTTGKLGGTGLGLTVAKKVVEAHGGEIGCSSKKNYGTEFYIDLPGQEANATAPLQIALIDDDPFVGELWQMSANGSNIHYFQSAEQFLEIVSGSPLLDVLSCVVTDFYFGEEEMRGSELARIVKSMKPDLPVFLSSNAQSEEEKLNDSFDGVLDKGQALDVNIVEIRKAL